MAVALAKGEKLDSIAKDSVDSPTTKGVPPARPRRVADQGQHQGHGHQGRHLHADEICTPKFKAACDKIGLE
jgi:D-xylose transport system substrate-binding protein